MKKHARLTVLMLGLLSCNNPLTNNIEKTADPIPIVKYISTSAYPTAKMTENKKGYVLGEKMQDGMGKYTFTFYIDHIILKTDEIVNLKIDKIDKRFAPNEYSFYVNDPKGARYLITVSNVKDHNNTYIDFYEDFRNDIYNGFTKIICKKID